MITRVELFDLVWAEPMIAVAKRFNVSGSYLARVCSRLNVPRPARGYWAKLAVGKAPVRPTLPQPRVGDEVSWDPDGGLPEVARTIAAPPVKNAVKRAATPIAWTKALHELVAGAKDHFLKGRETYQGKYLKPAKRLLPEIHVTKAALDSALKFANEFFKELERLGHRVTLASMGEHVHSPSIDTRDKPDGRNHHVGLWSPARGTVVYVNGTPIGLAIFELSESMQMRYVNGAYVPVKDDVAPKAKWAHDASWISTQEVPCGRFSVLAYTSYYTKSWSHTWKEERIGDFLKRVSQLAREVEGCEGKAAQAIRLGKEATQTEQQRYEQMHRAWQEKQEEERRQKVLLESKEELDRIIARYLQSKRLEDFIQYLEAKLPTIDVEVGVRLETLIHQARQLIQGGSVFEEFMAWRPPSERL